MHLRTSLAVATVLAATLLGPTDAANATDTPIGSPVASIAVDGVSTPGSVAIDGNLNGGSITFGGNTFGCGLGDLAGTVARGPITAAADLSLTTMTITCSGPLWGDSQTFSIKSGCSVPVNLGGAVNNGTVDTGTGPQYFNVRGNAVFGTGTCVQVSTLLGFCTANLQGAVSAAFDETVTTGGRQQLTLNGSGALANQSGCGGVYTGTFTLNNLGFDVKATTGAIDFRPAAPTSGGPVAAVEVNGNRAVGAVPVDGVYRIGNLSWGGSTYACSDGAAAGTVYRGPRPATGVHDLALTTLDLTCATAIGDTTWSIDPGCAINVDLPDTPNALGNAASVHDGTVDTGTATDYGPVAGRASLADHCLTVSGLFGYCTANITGNVNAAFDEAIKTVGGTNYQTLTLNGSGLSYTNQAGCGGALEGAVDLNNLTFHLQVSTGTTTGIDFRQTA